MKGSPSGLVASTALSSVYHLMSLTHHSLGPSLRRRHRDTSPHLFPPASLDQGSRPRSRDLVLLLRSLPQMHVRYISHSKKKPPREGGRHLKQGPCSCEPQPLPGGPSRSRSWACPQPLLMASPQPSLQANYNPSTSTSTAAANELFKILVREIISDLIVKVLVSEALSPSHRKTSGSAGITFLPSSRLRPAPPNALSAGVSSGRDTPHSADEDVKGFAYTHTSSDPLCYTF